MKLRAFTVLAVAGVSLSVAVAQTKPEDTEFYSPAVPVVTPAPYQPAPPPSDAIVLFDGDDLDQWISADGKSPARWTVEDGAFTVKKGTGNIRTKQSFGSYQLHLEWQVPKNITGNGQGRGNSGLFLASIGGGDAGYELQILDSYRNETYVNGMVGSIYKQHVPLANPMRAPGEWQTYDVIWTAPVFNADGSVKTKARVTAFLNGVLVQNDVEIQGETRWIGKPSYDKAHGPSPIKLQDHGDPSEPLSFRNVWIRELK